jgi:peptidoglycan/LPS O-acetylase OafA/YrhL
MAVPATAAGFRRRRLRRWAIIAGSWAITAGSWALVAATVTGAGVLPEDPDPYLGLQVLPLLILLMTLPCLRSGRTGRAERPVSARSTELAEPAAVGS